MLTVIYTCDRCKKEVDKLFAVAVGLKEHKYSSYGGSREYLHDELNREKELCEECLLDLGIKLRGKKKETVVQAYPTLDELVREIVREEMSG